MKILFTLALLVISQMAAAAPHVVLTDSTGLKWYALDTDARANEFDAWFACSDAGFTLPGRGDIRNARAELEAAYQQGVFGDECYWSAHSSAGTGLQEYLYVFDLDGSLAQLRAEAFTDAKRGCLVRCVDQR